MGADGVVGHTGEINVNFFFFFFFSGSLFCNGEWGRRPREYSLSHKEVRPMGNFIFTAPFTDILLLPTVLTALSKGNAAYSQ